MTLLLRPPVLAGLGLVALVVAAGRPRATAALVVLVAAVAVVAVVRGATPARRAERALAGVLLLWVAVPATRVSGDGLLLQAALAAGAVVPAACLLGRGRLRPPPGAGLLAALLGVLLVSTATAPDQGGLIRLLVTAVAALPPLWLTGALDREGARTAALVVVVLAAGQAALAVVEPWVVPEHLWGPAQTRSDGSPAPLLNELLRNGLERSQGTTGHPLPLGMLLLVALGLVLRPLRGLGGRASPLLVGLLLAGLVAAGARTALALALLLVVLAGGARTTVLRWYAAVLALAAAAAGAALLAPAAVQQTGESGSFLHRAGALAALGPLALEQPMSAVLGGNGFASVRRISSQGLLQTDGLVAVDNQLVSLFVQGGLVGVVLLLGLCAVAALRCARPWRPALAGALAMLLVFDVLTWPSATALVVLLLGVALRGEELTAPAPPAPPAPPSPPVPSSPRPGVPRTQGTPALAAGTGR